MERKTFKVMTYAEIPATPKPPMKGAPIDLFTWDELVEKFPELQEMQDYYSSLTPEMRDGEPYFCANESARRVVTKKILRGLMTGWTKCWPIDNCHAFWTAYDNIWWSQPDCRNCGCISMDDME